MEKRYLIGIDLGTTTIKAVFLDAKNDRIVTTQTEEIFPVKLDDPDAIEYDPNDWWEYICRILKRGFESGVDPEQVAGVCLGGFTLMALLAKNDGTPVINVIHYNDMRHVGLIDELKGMIGDIAAERNSNCVGMYGGMSKLFWWKKIRPEIFGQADVMATEVTWTNFKLTGQWAFNRTQAAFYNAYNFETREWDDEIIQKAGFPRSLFPKLVDSTEIMGYVTKQASEETGLAEGTPVFGGADDASPVAITTGVIQSGQGYISAGSGGNVASNSKKPVCHETIISFPHCIPGLVTVQTVMTTTGLSYKWMRNAFGQAETSLAELTGEDAFTYLNTQASVSKPGARGVIFLPYLDGDFTPNNDPNARGVFIGMDTATTKNDMLRAVLEGVAFCILDNIMLIRSLGGEMNEMVITGGVAKSPLWLQIIADVTGCPVSLPEETEGAPFGTAILAGVGAGLYRGFEEAVERVVKVQRNAFVPDTSNHALYSDLYKVYKDLYANLSGAFSQMQEIRETHGL